jgi:hypothetical protein
MVASLLGQEVVYHMDQAEGLQLDPVVVCPQGQEVECLQAPEAVYLAGRAEVFLGVRAEDYRVAPEAVFLGVRGEDCHEGLVVVYLVGQHLTTVIYLYEKSI